MIYCVEDDSSIRNLMIYTLNASGFEAEGFPDGVSFFEALEQRRPQLVILDIMLPGQDGLSILKALRSRPDTEDIPVIMATAKGTEYDRVTGLDLGADDYLSKPFGMMEMVSRIRAVLRRTGHKAPMVLRYRALAMDLSAHTVSIDGSPVSLTVKEFDLLRLLMEHPGRVFSREQLLQHIWQTSYVGETRTVDVHVGTLRTKLGDCSDYIQTVRGVGYRLEAMA